MVEKLTTSLRKNTWLLVAAFIGFSGSAFIGSLTVDSGTSTPVIWLAAMWAMLAVGAVIVIAVVIEAVTAMMGDG